MATGDTTDIVGRIRAALPTGWFPDDAPVLTGLLTGCAAMWSWLYGLVQTARAQARIATATGWWLDLIAADFLGSGLRRGAGQGDAAFRARLQAEILRPRNTRAAMRRMLLDLTGREPRIFEPRRPADTGAYAPGGAAAWGGVLYTTARAAPATWVDNAGLLRTAAPGVVRIAWDYGSGVARLVNEPAATNLLVWSEALANSAWTHGNLTVTAAAATGPGGDLTADMLTSTSTSAGYAYQAATISAGGRYALSWLVKAGTGSWCCIRLTDTTPTDGVRLWVNLGTGALGTVSVMGAGTVLASAVETLANGWVRVSIAGVIDGAVTTARAWLMPCSGNGTLAQVIGNTMYAGGAQCEAGAVTSYIPTAGAAVTRDADALAVVGAPVGGYGAIGGWGSLALPGQVFLDVFRSPDQGIPMVAGYGISAGAYNTPSRAVWASADQIGGTVTDADIMAAIDSTKPAGATAWTRIGM